MKEEIWSNIYSSSKYWVIVSVSNPLYTSSVTPVCPSVIPVNILFFSAWALNCVSFAAAISWPCWAFCTPVNCCSNNFSVPSALISNCPYSPCVTYCINCGYKVIKSKTCSLPFNKASVQAWVP